MPGRSADVATQATTTGSIKVMKVSVSLPPDDVAFLDAYTQAQGYGSRSAVVHKAVALLRAGELAGGYEDAWRSWASSDDAKVWDMVTADGLEA